MAEEDQNEEVLEEEEEDLTPPKKNKPKKCPFATISTLSTSSIQPYVIQWAMQCTYPLSHFHDPYTIVHGGDSMAHVMKGNVGILMNQIEDVCIRDTCIYNIENHMHKPSTYTHNPDATVCAENAFGILVNISNQVFVDKSSVFIDEIYSKNGCSYTYYETNFK